MQYALMDLTPLDRREYYNGFANRALWPTMHYRVGLSDFSRADYIGYRRVNHTFARALAPLTRPEDLVWVHDYHLIPLAEELRALGLTNRIGYFHHIPWPAPEVLATLPGSKELLSSIASYDLVGVQTERDADNLRRNLNEELGANRIAAPAAEASAHDTRIQCFPIGIDVSEFQQVAARSGSSRLVRQTSAGLAPANSSSALIASIIRKGSQREWQLTSGFCLITWISGAVSRTSRLRRRAEARSLSTQP